MAFLLANRIFWSLLLGTWFCLVAAATHACEQPAAILEVAEGTVELRYAPDSWQPVDVGTALCYGDALRVLQARAALRLANDTLVRLQQGSVVHFQKAENSFWLELTEGIGHFISRTPRSMEVKTPYLNAAIEGTEFVVATHGNLSRVSVIEGSVTVSNSLGQVNLKGNTSASAQPNQSPMLDPGIKLVDTVSWAFHYPVLNSLFYPAPAALRQAAASGHYATALADLKNTATIEQLWRLNAKTALALALGRIDDAMAWNKDALAVASDSPEAEAARALILLTQGYRDEAASVIARGLDSHPRNQTVLLVASYIDQAQFRLERAYAHAQKASEHAALEPQVWLRIAELAILLEKTDDAQQALHNAEKLNARSTEVLVLKGLISLKQLEFSASLEDFQNAVRADNSNPLAHFLLGLNLYRIGKAVEGRKKVELAALLDPNKSLYRSYLGRIYYSENRFDKAYDQFALAKILDADDPTPYFYQAVQYQAMAAPINAVHELEQSIVRNGNRAVVRSRIQLNSDYSTRAASLASAYQELNVSQQAIRIAEEAKRVSPQEFSPYRSVLESLSNEPRFGTAKTSEYLQALVRQPLTALPIRPSSAATQLLLVPGAGPSELGLSEYNPLLTRNEVNLLLSAATLSDSEYSYNAAVSGLYGKYSFLAEAFTNDSDNIPGIGNQNSQLSAFYFQSKPVKNVNYFIELHDSEVERDNQAPQTDSRVTQLFSEQESATSAAIGLSVFDIQGVNLYSIVGFRDHDYENATNTEITLGSNAINRSTVSGENTEVSELELNAEWNDKYGLFRLGFKYSDFSKGLAYATAQGTNSIFEAPVGETYFGDVEYAKTYGYWTIPMSNILNLLLGYSDIKYESLDFDGKQLSMGAAKAALNISPTPNMNIDLAYFENLTPPSEGRHSLEPTHLFGVIQLFDDPTASSSETYGAALDYSKRGWSFNARHYNRTFDYPGLETGETNLFDERILSANIGKQFSNVSITFSLDLSSIDTLNNDSATIPDELDTKSAPLSMGYFNHRGLIVSADILPVWQRTRFIDEGTLTTESYEEDFVLVNIKVAQTLMKSLGKSLLLSLEVSNAFNKKFEYQNLDFIDNEPFIPIYSKERMYLGKATWLF